MKRTLTVLLTCLLAQAPAAARWQPQQQTPAPTPTPAPQAAEHDEDDVVRITSNLVQIDAVVTDKKGRQVTDLRAEEFEILADGKPQKITNFAYVQNVPDAEPTPAPLAAGKSNVAAPPPPRLRPEQVRRTVAFVFNDLQMSWESVYYARRAIQKFLDEQMQPGDFVAIIPAAGGSGALQQFTNDKRLLNAAVKNLRWHPEYGAGVRAYQPPDFSLPPEVQESEAERSYFARRGERFSVGTINSLEAVVGALGDLPGRKSLVLLSDGVPLPPPDEDSGRVLAGVNRVIESANRASVSIYAVDPRGLQTPDYFDASTPSVQDITRIPQLMRSNSLAMADSQIGMRRLAEETGGVAYVNSNDIGGGVRRALEDQRGYYLIGYRPDEETFDPASGRLRYHKLKLSVTRPGLKVRTRRGFFGFEGKGVTPGAAPATRAQQLRAALVSPFPAGGVSLRLTPLFGQDAKQGAYVRSLIHIDGDDLTFRRQPDGGYKSVIDVVALTFGTKGLVVAEANTTHEVTVSERVYKQIQEAGLLYNMVVPTKKPGGYQLRVAVRDSATGRVGSASQYVEVPDVKNGRLALSGIILRSSAGALARQKPEEAPADGPAPPPSDPQGSPAVRRFRRGSVVDYGFYIYNAKTDRADGLPHLLTQLRLFRDGKLVYEGKVQPFDGPALNGNGDIGAGGNLQLGTVLGPGEYALQMVVTDTLAKEKQRVASQWIDFEVID